MNEKKHKHMTLADRTEIQECLYKRMTFKAIANLIGKDPTTVSKEVKLHARAHTNSFVKLSEPCPKLLKAPFVCNGCKLKSSASCHYTRRIYTAATAQKQYEETLVSSREGIALNKSEFYEDDRIISERIKAGQHLNQILPDISSSKSSVYRYFNKGYLSASKIDLPRAVKFKPRKSKPSEYVPKGVKIGRSYDDFLSFMQEHSLSAHQELDTVIGRPGGKVLMTVHFTATGFMFALLLENKTAAEVSSKIRSLKNRLNENGFCFGEIFPVILTDNGGEFSDVFSIECNSDGVEESKLFFCDPMRSCQKPYIEKNHTLLRDILPKGTSFDSFTQESADLVFSHVNCVKRPVFNNKTPYEMMAFLYSKELLDLLGIQEIPADKVIQTTRLQKTAAFQKTLV